LSLEVIMPREASIAEARGKLSLVVNAVAHGHERVLLTSRGRPKAALVGLADLAALEDLQPSTGRDESVLSEVEAFSQRVFNRGGSLLSDSADDLAALRDERERLVRSVPL
jgi:prevent-host-death family protein